MARADFPLPRHGRLDKRITIRRRQDHPAGTWQVQTEHQDPVQRWADLRPVGTQVWQGSVQTGAEVTHRCVIRHLPGLSADHEVLHHGVVYRVRRVADLQGRRRYTVLELEQLGTEEAIYGGQ